METDFLKNLNSGSFQGPVGRIQLSVVEASQLTKNGERASSNIGEGLAGGWEYGGCVSADDSSVS